MSSTRAAAPRVVSTPNERSIDSRSTVSAGGGVNVWMSVPDSAVCRACGMDSPGTRIGRVEAFTVCRTATRSTMTPISHQVSRPSASPTWAQSTARSACTAR